MTCQTGFLLLTGQEACLTVDKKYDKQEYKVCSTETTSCPLGTQEHKNTGKKWLEVAAGQMVNGFSLLIECSQIIKKMHCDNLYQLGLTVPHIEIEKSDEIWKSSKGFE